MFDMRNLWSGLRKTVGAFAVLLFVFVVCMAFNSSGSTDFELARKEVMLRKIGHELLLQSGDSASKVLPVKKIAENEYQIRFEKELGFDPDSLVNTTRRLLAKTPMTADYVVNVVNCGSTDVVFGYAMSSKDQDNIVACVGRKQPVACYVIHVKFKPTDVKTAGNKYLLGSLPILAVVGFIFLISSKARKASDNNNDTRKFTLGQVVFDAQQKQLLINGKTIDLTGTETRLLLIFASSPNSTIARTRLQKEIWEDEGIIVGRSLDMFISKLRKKLKDANIHINVVRGTGYKLEIGGKGNLD